MARGGLQTEPHGRRAPCARPLQPPRHGSLHRQHRAHIPLGLGLHSSHRARSPRCRSPRAGQCHQAPPGTNPVRRLPTTRFCFWIHCQRCNGSALDLNHLKSARACPICGHGGLGSSVNLLGVSAEAPGCLFQDLERSEEAGAPVAQPIHFVFPSQAARGGSSGRSDPPPQRLGRGTSHHLPPPPTSLEKPLFKGRR